MGWYQGRLECAGIAGIKAHSGSVRVDGVITGYARVRWGYWGKGAFRISQGFCGDIRIGKSALGLPGQGRFKISQVFFGSNRIG